MGKWFFSCAQGRSGHPARTGLTELTCFAKCLLCDCTCWAPCSGANLPTPSPSRIPAPLLSPYFFLCAYLSVFSNWLVLLAFIHSFLSSQPLVRWVMLRTPSILVEDFCSGCAWSGHDHTLLAEDREIMMHRAMLAPDFCLGLPRHPESPP